MKNLNNLSYGYLFVFSNGKVSKNLGSRILVENTGLGFARKIITGQKFRAIKSNGFPFLNSLYVKLGIEFSADTVDEIKLLRETILNYKNEHSSIEEWQKELESYELESNEILLYTRNKKRQVLKEKKKLKEETIGLIRSLRK